MNSGLCLVISADEEDVAMLSGQQHGQVELRSHRVMRKPRLGPRLINRTASSLVEWYKDDLGHSGAGAR